MTRIDERERSAWIAALARRIRRLAGAGRPARARSPRAESRPPAGESPPPGAGEAR